MNGTYNLWLVALSIVIAFFASFTVFHLAGRIQAVHHFALKSLLFMAALAMGGGIWSMHFVAMLAFNLPVPVNYDVLTTLISLLVAIFMTGVALFTVSYRQMTFAKLAAGGFFMGTGIVSMHYIGMAAMLVEARISYDTLLVATSVAIAIVASTAALWLAFNLRIAWHKVGSALLMGGAIAGMHFTGMAAASFQAASLPSSYDSLAIAPSFLAVIIAVATFVYLIFALLSALPDDPNLSQRQPEATTRDGQNFIKKLPIYRDRKVALLELQNVIHLRANGHHTTAFTCDGQHECNLSVTELEAKLDPRTFIRVHRSHIINIQYAKAFERETDQATIVVESDGETKIPVSREKVQALRTMLGI